MARSHGFRVYIAEAFPNRKSGNSPLNAAAGSALRDEIELLLERLVARDTIRFAPRPAPDGQPSRRPVQTATLHSIEPIGADVIHVTISVGETGSHARATRPKKKTKDLTNWSPEVEHYVTFVFPQDKDSRFFIVAQTVNRRDPALRMISLLQQASMQRREELKLEDKERQKDARARGEKPQPRQHRTRLAIDLAQAADQAYLEEILSNADTASVVFKSERLDGRGQSREIERVLQIKLRDRLIFDVGQKIARTWNGRFRRGEQTTQQQAVSEVSDLLEEADLFTEDEEARYTSAAISVRSKSKATTTIAADTLREAFTYPVTDFRPDPYTHYSAVAERLTKIADQYSIETAPIDPHEVARCLSGSIQARS